MALRYRFDPVIQAALGLFGFLVVLPVQYVFSGEVNLIAGIIVGLGNFLVAGFYAEYYRDPEECTCRGRG